MEHTMRRINGITLASAFALLGSLAIVSAQAPTVKRTVLQRGDLSAPGREVVQAKAEIPGGGGTTGRHTHPGEEVSYVMEGAITLDVDGAPSRTLKAGDVFIIPAGAIHNATNSQTAGAAILATYIVEKGKPLTTPVP
jgi:quercetin dioxygenase-like cupin family protein